MKRPIDSIAEIWPGIANIFAVPDTEAEYKDLIETIDNLLNKIDGDHSHPLCGMLDLLVILAKNYEDENCVINDADPIDVLKYLMEEHCLTQADFKNELGSQGVVSEILHGIRKLNARQIEKLSKRFSVSPAVFMKV